jgi:fructose-1,6-bisphosphatase I
MIPTRTLERVVRAQERLHPDSTGELSDLLTSIGLGVKIISQIVATAGFKGLYGYSGRTNVQDEQTRLLDEEADQVLVEILGSSGHFGLLVSEERDSVVATNSGHEHAKYVVAFDPLDGSSNIGSNIPVGTIFSIFKKRDLSRAAAAEDFFQPGAHLVAAGYSVYGAKTSFVYSTGNGVLDFTLDPSIGEFVLTEETIRIPERGNIFSVNEGNAPYWSKGVANYVSHLKTVDKDAGYPYTSRYVGSLVADFDRTIRKGGIFLYPASSKHPKGRLRLLYEVVPLSYIMEQAGGIAVTGTKQRVLDIEPTDIHQRCPLVVGSPWDVREFLRISNAE